MTMKTLTATCAVLGMFVAPLSAELKFTMHIEAHASKAPAAAAPDPMMAMAAAMILRTMLPEGATDATCVLGAKGTRCEVTKAMDTMPARSVVIVKPDGSSVGFDDATKTFWKVGGPGSASASAMPGGVAPDIKETRTGEKATIAGISAEHITMVIRVPTPMPAGTQPPPGMPTEFVINADKWMTHQYDATYKTALSNASPMTGLAGLTGKTGGEGFIMRQTVRGSMFGDQEIETVVTKIAEGPADAALFEVPAGYKEVPAPQPKIGGGL